MKRILLLSVLLFFVSCSSNHNAGKLNEVIKTSILFKNNSHKTGYVKHFFYQDGSDGLDLLNDDTKELEIGPDASFYLKDDLKKSYYSLYTEKALMAAIEFNDGSKKDVEVELKPVVMNNIVSYEATVLIKEIEKK